MHTNKNTFAIFLSNNFSIPETHRWDLIKRYLKEGLGPNVKVLLESVFISIGQYSGIIIVESSSEKDVIKAIEPAKDIYDISISLVALDKDSGQCEEFGYCLYSFHEDAEEETISNSILDSDFVSEVNIHTKAEFLNNGAIRSILFLKAPSIVHANFFGKMHYPNKKMVCLPILSLDEFFKAKTEINTVETKPEIEVITANQQALHEATANSFQIINQGKEAFYCADAAPDELNYLALFKKQKKIEPGASFSCIGTTYFWKSLTSSITIYQTDTSSVGNNVSINHYTYTLTNNAATPILNLKPAAGTQLGVNLDKGIEINNISKLNTFLHDLLNTTKYDCKWPGDTYVGDDLDAYNYIVSQLPGHIPPRNGTIKPSLVLAINFPQNTPLSKASFDKVKKVLVDECTYFQYANDWFGANGIFNVIILQIANAQQNELSRAANLMGISQNKGLTLFMESIMADFLGVVSAIPTIGAAISAILRISFNGIKDGIASGSLSNAIKATVAEMSQELTDYLQIMVNTIAKQHTEINGNYGKLKAFTDAVTSKLITTDKFGIDDIYANADAKTSEAAKLPQGYIEAAAKTWGIVFYKALFNVKPYPSEMYIELTSKVDNRYLWSPKYFDFSYYLPGAWVDISKNTTTGFLEFSCNYNAPRAALSDLFGPRINLNPIELFLGINGWPKIVDKFSQDGDNSHTITKVG
jgi:hypothetical protein